MMLLGLDWMAKRRATTKCTNRIVSGRFQAVFRHRISHAKNEHDFDFLLWSETLGCIITLHNEKLGLSHYFLPKTSAKPNREELGAFQPSLQNGLVYLIFT